LVLSPEFLVSGMNGWPRLRPAPEVRRLFPRFVTLAELDSPKKIGCAALSRNTFTLPPVPRASALLSPAELCARPSCSPFIFRAHRGPPWPPFSPTSSRRQRFAGGPFARRFRKPRFTHEGSPSEKAPREEGLNHAILQAESVIIPLPSAS